MNFTSHEIAILALSMASVLVRVLPALLPNRLNKTAHDMLQRELPLAVFINFSMYIAWTEIQVEPIPAIAAITTAAVFSLATHLGLILIAAGSTVLYVFFLHLL
ncbi:MULTISPECIES: hypothetical protein [Herbaspirillum]|jgi:hypothetical protein|uniref:Uncharacterized protein YjeT (DUF2065 family) n=1 Tax=Herbaspirillum frisingense TaxID=92645 RepID=A0ABU1PCF7_9BURK|nr:MULTISPECIES: hypothetical protein [Herbaspirillum]MDR6583613.1 uncharacterized protein YjeT (DUF2065 family) [Herbaspirillum frisingense]